MHSRLVRLARSICKFVYRLLPAGVCTRLACSQFGSVVGSWLTPKGIALYECDFGIKLRLSQEDAITYGIAHMGRINPLETELVRKYLKVGNTLVQVGTYRDGWFSLVGSSIVGVQGRVICFEPIPEFCESLRQNIELNNRRNITVEQFALSDATGKVTFSVAGSNSSLVLMGKPDTVKAKTVTLDEYVCSHGIKAVDFLIVDVEGAEPLVLKGALRTLAGSVSFLLMEVIDDFLRQSGTTAHQLIQSVVSMGFHPYTVTRRGLQPWEPGRSSETLNMFFSRRDILSAEPADASPRATHA